MTTETKTEFPRVFAQILTNCDTEGRWRKHIVEESLFDEFTPSCQYDEETITVYLPGEYIAMSRNEIRRCMTWVVRCVNEGVDIDTMPKGLKRFFKSQRYRDERRRFVLEDIGVKSGHRKVPEEFNDAMALHPGLRECLDGMAFLYCETGEDGMISYSDYISRTIVLSKEVFRHPDRLLRTYVVYRELASTVAVHPVGPYGMRPNPEEMMRFMKRFQNWSAYEMRCMEMGWRFRYPIGGL